MKSRRSFFRRIAAIAVAAAIAPEIVFAARTSPPVAVDMSQLFRHDFETRSLGHRSHDLYDYLMSREQAAHWEREYPKAMERYLDAKINTPSPGELAKLFGV